MRVRIELGEYERRKITVPAPTSTDIRLAEQLTGDGLEPRIAIRWLATGEVDITASSWVGVIRFSQLDVHVVPKLVGGPLRVLRMLEYAAGVSMISRLPADRPLPANGTDLFDLICQLLAEETKSLVRDGLLRDYRPVDDALDVMRGRLRYRDQYLRRYGQLHPLECHYDEYDSNMPDNQLVAAALDAARRRVQDPDIRAITLRLAGMMSEVCEPPTADAGWYEQVIQYTRRNGRYRPVHELSKLVLRGLAFDDMYDTSAGQVTAFMLDMNTIFERFVTRLVEDSLKASGLRSSTQTPLRAVICNDATGRSYSTIRPDLVIEELSTGRSVPIDIKYKLYGDRKFSTSDIYQMFLYAYALGGDASSRRAGLVYASLSAVSGPLLSINPVAGPTAARIVGSGLDVPAALDALSGPGRQQLCDSVRTMIEGVTGFSSVAKKSAV